MFLIRPAGLIWHHRSSVAAFDFQIGDFTQDGAWHSKSIASIVPANAKLASLKMLYSAPAAGRFFGLRVAGITYAYNTYGIVSVVATAQHETNILFPMTTAQAFEYYLPAAGSTMASLVFQGWFT